MGPASSLRHFLDLDRIERATLRRIIDEGSRFKQQPRSGAQPLAGKALALIFEKPSTRTRVSFELAMRQLGGDVIVLERDGSQLGRGETIGVFQLEGAGMTRYLKELKPSRVQDIYAMVALYRPGPLEQIPRYIEFVPEFPMTITGKIQKFVMREQTVGKLGLKAEKTA